LTDQSGRPDDILIFANRCQVAVGSWQMAMDLVSRLAPFWTVLLEDMPNGARSDTPVVARIVVSFAEHLRSANEPSEYPGSALPVSSIARLKVMRALAFILRNHMDLHIDLGAVAADIGVSGCYLSRILVREGGHAFETHLHGSRVLDAALRLHDTLDPIGQIADQVGYGSLTLLERHFHRWLRTTPSDFRLAASARWQ
jgi:AraC-like DNA-binding protein